MFDTYLALYSLAATVKEIHNGLPLAAVGDFEAFTFILALNPPFCQTAVMRSAFYFFLIFDIVCPMDLVGLSISLIAKSMASCINAFTFGFL